MRDLYRAYCARLFANKLFLAGTALAFAITYYITANGLTLHRFGMYETDFDYSLTVSLGIPGFFSIFTALFLGAEYKEGTIRNKLACGKTRTEIYVSSLAAMMTALTVMTAAWLAGALIGANTLPSAEIVAIFTAKILLYNTANLAVLVFLSMNITKTEAALAVEFGIFQFGWFMALALQGLMCIAEGASLEMLKLMLNIIPFGQWLIASLIGSREFMMSPGTQMAFSAVIASVMTVSGIALIAKKDIK